MASVASEPNGNRRILFTDPDGKRRTLRLGKLPKKQADAVRVKVESLLSAKLSGQPVEPETARWVQQLGDTLHSKLAGVGLVEGRSSARLGSFIDEYIDRRKPRLKTATILNLNQARDHLTRNLGQERDLRSITSADAEDWQATLRKTGLGENTIRRTTGRARQFFRNAQSRGVVESNPFEGLAASVRPERSRDHFVTREETQKVLDACPDVEWRAMFALARFGGLRTPSETLLLRWGDIDWANGRFTVRSPKTEHHDGKGSRIVPLFPELVPHLRDAFEQADEGEEFVITRYRAGANVGPQLKRIVERAGVKPWPKLWQNCRASRATELAQQFPQHVATAWMGHSAKIAEAHYLQVTAEHFAEASGDAVRTDEERVKSAAQNPAQQPPAHPRTDSPSTKKNRTQTQGIASGCGEVARPGLEPGTPAFSMPWLTCV